MLPLWVTFVPPAVTLVLSVSLYSMANRERGLRRRLKCEGTEVDATVTEVQSHGLAARASFLILRLTYLADHGKEVPATAIASAQPGAHALKGHTIKVSYLPTKPKAARLPSELSDDAYPKQMRKAGRQQLALTGIMALLACVRLAGHLMGH